MKIMLFIMAIVCLGLFGFVKYEIKTDTTQDLIPKEDPRMTVDGDILIGIYSGNCEQNRIRLEKEAAEKQELFMLEGRLIDVPMINSCYHQIPNYKE